MIVVDDEPEAVLNNHRKIFWVRLKTPSRRDVAAAQKENKKPDAIRSHPLDAKGLDKGARWI